MAALSNICLYSCFLFADTKACRKKVSLDVGQVQVEAFSITSASFSLFNYHIHYKIVMPPRLFFSRSQTKSAVNLFKKLFSSVSHEHGFPISPFLLSSLSLLPPFAWRGCRCWWCRRITTSFLWQWNTFDAVCAVTQRAGFFQRHQLRWCSNYRGFSGEIRFELVVGFVIRPGPRQTWFIHEKVHVLHLKLLVKAYFEVQVTEAIAVSCLQTACCAGFAFCTLGAFAHGVHSPSRRAEEIMQSINQCRHVKVGNKSRRKC